MIPLDDARAHVLERCEPIAVTKLRVDDALGAVLAESVEAAEAVPPFANTAMDGFAVRSADVADAPVDLDIVGTIPAGHAPDFTVGTGQAARIMTGALLPDGADAVVMVERTRAEGDRVHVEISVPEGNHVRPAGDDITAGTTVFEAGTELGPGHLGVLQSIGVRTVAARPPLRIGVISTGDELVDDGRDLEPGQIRDSNRRTLLSLVARHGAVPVDLGLAPDDEDAIEAAIRKGAIECDAVLSSGGVSMGDFDYVKAVLDRIGDMRWMQIAIRPAKPFAFGLVDDTPIFGLPGNPVSSMVSFELLARPGLRALQGLPDPVRPMLWGQAGEDFGRRPDDKTHFLRVVAEPNDDGVFVARSSGGQGSHMLWAMANANALAAIPDGDGVEQGGAVELLLL